MTGRFAGHRALVTGASGGIGAGIAERLAAEGADVVITPRLAGAHGGGTGSIEETVARLARYGTSVGTVVAELTDARDRARIVPEACTLLGGHVTILVNNAAAAITLPLLDFPLERRHEVFEVNLHAPLDLATAVVPAMRDAGEGWIVNLSSAAARPSEGPPFALGAQGTTHAIYGASKAALNRLTNGLAAELFGAGIRVNTVEPRAAVLNETTAHLVDAGMPRASFESMEEMAEAVVALCDCPPELTGQVCVSRDLIDRLGLVVHRLDGAAP